VTVKIKRAFTSQVCATSVPTSTNACYICHIVIHIA